jgi:hypothetical protein
MVNTTLQYIAGFFDGEGCIGIYYRKKTKDRFHLRTQLSQNKNKDIEILMNELVERFGGNLSEQITLSGNIKYNWQLNSDFAVKFLEDICPYLILKKEQAIISINWQKHRPERIRDKNGRICLKRKPDIEKDIMIAEKVKELKKC